MKAEEIMIGDWLKWKDKYVQVAMVSGVKWSFGHIDVTLAHCNDEKLLETHDIKSISPILLTPEILEKNGWTYNDENSKFYPDTWSDNGIMLRKEGYRFRIVVVSDYDDEDTNDTQFVLQYVSDLQHALKLLKIEKEIVL